MVLKLIRVSVGAVWWGTALQARMSYLWFLKESLEFFIDLQLLKEMSTRSISWRLKAAGVWGCRPYHLHVPTVEKFCEPEPTSQVCRGTALRSKLIPWGAAILQNHDVYPLRNFLIDSNHKRHYRDYKDPRQVRLLSQIN